ncbi:response regulator [Sulfitobacter albidus]|uniref:Response regulator n=1 Tax=Sulfitobacter albidus TaxID=2829501 RepID=A0A975PL52_9RHOB|nr:response regulator [Sulfitobacter albidus]QUJ75407.1 response regulator [Sulfitobacter albidus]
MSHFTPVAASRSSVAQTLPPLARILIVEDQRFDRVRLERMCKTFDFAVQMDEASTLAGMIDRLEAQSYDLVLLDYHLPDGSGLQGVEMIRDSTLNALTATIMITGTAEARVADRALRMGFSDYLTKDELSAETLQRAAITAIQKSRLSTTVTITGARAEETDAVLQGFSRDCASEMKPIVSRMMRQMRALRHLPADQADAQIARLEDSCRTLHGFLDDLQRFAERPPPASSPRKGASGAAPPSPFSWARPYPRKTH